MVSVEYAENRPSVVLGGGAVRVECVSVSLWRGHTLQSEECFVQSHHNTRVKVRLSDLLDRAIRQLGLLSFLL